jgi:hypothetical protein
MSFLFSLSPKKYIKTSISMSVYTYFGSDIVYALR